ncbi:phosphatase PAP2 family protein [Streptococcus castoreus]|uniref:phosphatase PAP2 family protein n=1 Tax=Streptococcus castoreus TaxID=254786 RepID=UPI0004219869|nr:phosphatase PAP2 family protein [Streptococcus castoreus]
MKNKQNHFLVASFALLLFVMVGYMVKFFPEQLTLLDNNIQTAIRGNLPQAWTQLFRVMTVFGNISMQILVVALSVFSLLLVRWKIEALLILSNGFIAAILISSLKYLYQRPRPSIEHLVYASGFSFPSGHAMGSLLIFGSLLIVFHQRIKTKPLQLAGDAIFVTLILLIGLSRVYLGVHYPSDVLAGFILGFGVLHLVYPYYDKKRFEWRFQRKQP